MVLALACRPPEREGGAVLLATLGAAADRPFEARLSLDVRHVACDAAEAPRCAPVPRPGTPAFTRLADASQRVVKAVQKGDGTPSPHAEGMVELLWYGGGAGKDLARAIGRLDAAAEADSSASALNDLAVAYMLRATDRDTPFDFVEALERIERAMARDSTYAPARFNRALLLETFSLLPEAAQAWDEYLALDATTPWADEARTRRDRDVERATAAQVDPAEVIRAAVAAGDSAGLAGRAREYAQEAREIGYDEVLPAWGRARLAGDGEGAAAALRAAGALGDPLVDRSLADAVALIGEGRGDLSKRAEAHRLFGEGRAAYVRGDMDEAVRIFESVARLLPTGDPVRMWADAWRGTAYFIDLRYDRAAPIFRGLISGADAARWPTVTGRGSWGLGIIGTRRGDAESAWEHLERAGNLFGIAGEVVNTSFLRTLGGEALEHLGRPQDAWRQYLQAFQGLGRRPRTNRLHAALYLAAESVDRLGRPAAALAFQDVDVRSSTVAYFSTEALERRARLRSRVGRWAGAVADLESARERLATVPQEGNRRIGLAGIQFTQATIDVARAPADAVVLLDSVLAFDQSVDNGLRTADALRLRALARERAGDRAGAAADLLLALERIEQLGASMKPGDDVMAFAATSRAVVEGLTAFRAFADGDPESALAAHERGQAFTVSVARGPAHRGGDIRGSLAALPEDMLVLEYAILGDTVALWTLARDSMEFSVLDVGASALERRVSAFVTAVNADDGAAADSLGAGLFADLMPSGVRRRLTGKQVAIVPDGFLGGTPFSALREPESGRYAVELWPITVSPSLTFLAGAVTAAPLSRGPTVGALLVGDPALDRLALPEFAELPEARREVEEVAALYGSPRTLDGARATAAEIRDAIGGAAIFHYAGHAVYDPDLPGASRLVLSDAGGAAADFVYTAELRTWPLQSLRLVILSACSSVTPSRTGTGGFWGLAEPFLAVGARAVVGSLWEVGDESGRRLITDFHRAWLRGDDAAAALRAAQLALIRDPEGRFAAPRFWAATQVIGFAR